MEERELEKVSRMPMPSDRARPSAHEQRDYGALAPPSLSHIQIGQTVIPSALGIVKGRSQSFADLPLAFVAPVPAAVATFLPAILFGVETLLFGFAVA